jgi:hypothetical protein
MRAPGAVHPNLKKESNGKVAVNATDLSESGYDFSRFYWGTHSDKSYVNPVNAGQKDGDKGDVNGSNGEILDHSRAGVVAFNGGWCAVKEGSVSVGAFGGDNGHDDWKNKSASSVGKLKENLTSLQGQKFKVDANGKMALVECDESGGCNWRGMNHYSQFQCIQVKSAGAGWTYDKLANKSTQNNPGYEYVLNECTKKSNCTETSRGDCLECRRLQLDNNGNGTCTGSGSATCAEGKSDNENKVGFVSLRYGFEDREAPTNNADLANHDDIPDDLRGCVAEEMFEDVLCPATGNFSFGIDGQKPRFAGFSMSPYGKVNCFKEEVCGDSHKDASERCDYALDSSCRSENDVGACQCQTVSCPEGSTEETRVDCDDPVQENDGIETYCEDVTCKKKFTSGPEGQPGTLQGSYQETENFTCGGGYEGGKGWTCGADGVFRGGTGCTKCKKGWASVNGADCTECPGPVKYPSGSSTCNTACLIVLDDPGSIAVDSGSCTANDLTLEPGESCSLECKDGYYFNSSASDGDDMTAAGTTTVRCPPDGKGTFNMKCLSRERNINTYIPGAGSVEKSRLMMWIDASHGVNLDANAQNSVSEVFDLSGLENHLQQDAGVTKVRSWSQGEKVKDVEDDNYKKITKQGLQFTKSSLARCPDGCGSSIGTLKTLFVVFKPNSSINYHSDGSFQGLLGFGGSCGHGIHFGEYLHTENRDSTEVITVVGARDGSCLAQTSTWRSDTSPSMIAGKPYMVVLRWQESRTPSSMGVQLLGGDNMTCTGCGPKSNSPMVEKSGVRDVRVSNLGLGYARQHPKTVSWQVGSYSERWDDTHSHLPTGDYDKFDLFQSEVRREVDALVDDMTNSQQAALLKHYKENGFSLRAKCYETQGTNNDYCLNMDGVTGGSGCNASPKKKTYESGGFSAQGTLKGWLNKAIMDQWDYFKDWVEDEEGSINIQRLETKITFPPVELVFPTTNYDAGSHRKSFDGDIGELLMFSNDLTESQTQSIIKYLAKKWGVTNTYY